MAAVIVHRVVTSLCIPSVSLQHQWCQEDAYRTRAVKAPVIHAGEETARRDSDTPLTDEKQDAILVP
jgi:hypothetical protein